MSTLTPPPPPPPPTAPGGEDRAGGRRRRDDLVRRPATWYRSASDWVARRSVAAEQRAARPPRPRPQGASAVTSTATAMVALLCGWVLLHLLVLGNVSHARSQDLLYDQFRTELAGLTAPVGPVVPAGDPVAILRIPALGVEEVVVEGTAAGDLFAGPGHKRNTVLPGQTGVSLVYGRSTTYGAPFAGLGELVPGDLLQIVTAQGEMDLEVLGIRRDGDPLPQPLAEGATRLTLVTSEGAGRLAGLSAGDALYVDAETGEGFPAPGGVPPVVPASEDAMERGTEALPMLCLCLALLTALTAAVIAAVQRWDAVLVWVVATPVAVALAWGTTDAAMRLLPNLI